MRAWVGLGSNLGDRLALLRAARRALDVDPATRVVAGSRVYETPPIGPGDQGPYLNAALAVDTDRSPHELLELLLATELVLGRDRSPQALRWGPRTIDLDLLLFEERCIQDDALEVPHPRLHERAFVLVPLADVAADVVHPRLGRSVGSLAADAPGREEVVVLAGVGTGDWEGTDPPG